MTSESRADGRTFETRDLTLALLASRLAEISEQIGGLAVRLGAAEAAVSEQASLLAEVTDLAREVSRLSTRIAREDSPARGRVASAHPRQPVWAAMNHDEYGDALRDLAQWVSGALFRRYPAIAVAVPPCWPGHPPVVEELDWLYWDWTAWALEPDARSRDAADWHDRWLPGVLARIRPELALCRQRGRHVEPASQRQVPADLNVAGRAPEAVFIAQMTRNGRRDRRAASRPS